MISGTRKGLALLVVEVDWDSDEERDCLVLGGIVRDVREVFWNYEVVMDR